ncbi:hypothetical protein [Schinkia azotoformans]|uniref:hypothetical protein n=1 Tax=Schinkia azotoformans TaxID=1454 RepID=UPI002DB8DDCD|nr:hypothetical protein [Schinkia azotoformans]MEC1697760.1 hypothetical protein [Schinkia azotoformans]
MSRIIELISKGTELKADLKLENIRKISEWLTEVQLYAELKYKGLSFTKSLVTNIDSFNASALSYQVISEDVFDMILGSVEGIKNYEENNSLEDALSKMK